MNTIKGIRLMMVAGVAALTMLPALAQEAAANSAPAAKKEAASATKSSDGKTYKPIAEARAKIGDIIADPAKMTETMKELSPEDQKTFVADVNAAISKLPGSVEDKTAKYLNINRAALKGAAEGNMANILAVTFATVPPASLTVISERYATDLFSRDTGSSQNLSNPDYERTAKEVIGKVETATSGSDDAGVRNTLAIIMFIKADNGKTEGLADRLVETIPDSTSRELAKKEWIPAATAEGENKSYDGMLAYADAGKAPNIDVVITLAGPQILDAALVDMTSGIDDNLNYQTTPMLDQAFGGFDEAAVNAAELHDTKSAMAAMNGGTAETPRTVADVPWNPEYGRGDSNKPTPGPQPYPFTEM